MYGTSNDSQASKSSIRGPEQLLGWSNGTEGIRTNVSFIPESVSEIRVVKLENKGNGNKRVRKEIIDAP